MHRKEGELDYRERRDDGAEASAKIAVLPLQQQQKRRGRGDAADRAARNGEKGTH